MINTLSHLISSQSLNLGGRRGTTDDVATITFYPSLSSAAPRESPNPIPVHSLRLSSHLFFCLPLLLAPFTVPCRIVFAMSEDLEMWPYHLSFLFFIMVRRSSCTPLHSGFCCESPRSSHGLCRKYSEVSYSISPQGLGSFSRFLLSRSSFHRHKWRWASARMMLSLMLYFLIVAHKASCLALSKPSWSLWRHVRDSADAAGIARQGSWDWIFVLWCSFRLWNLLAVCNDLFCLWLECVKDDLPTDLTRMADKADGSVVLAQLQTSGSVLTRDWVHMS